jgi:RNA polymerase sigma-70 factor, ECF subfamily
MQLIEDRLRSLMLESLAGDAAAYRVFLDELTARLRFYLRRRLGGLPDEVEDLLQELLLAVHNKRHTYDPRQPLTAWVQAIARYKLVDLLRRRSRSDVLTDPLDEEDQIFGTTANDAAEAQYDVAKLLSGLPSLATPRPNPNPLRSVAFEPLGSRSGFGFARASPCRRQSVPDPSSPRGLREGRRATIRLHGIAHGRHAALLGILIGPREYARLMA